MNSPIADDQFQAARLAFQRAKEQHACSCLSEAIESCHETLELLTRAVGEDASEKIPVLLFLADLLIQTDRLAEAETIVRDSDCLSSQTSATDFQWWLRTQHRLGIILRLQTRYPEAEVILHTAEQIARERAGLTNPTTISLINERGVLFKAMGKFEQATNCYREVFTALRTSSQAEPASLAGVLHNLGGLAHEQRDFLKAEQYAREAVRLRLDLHGPDHPETALEKAALAAILDGAEKFEEALHLYEEVIRIFRKHCGPEHSEVAVNMHNLGSLLSRMGRLEEARCICKEALQLKEARLGLEHLDLATTLNSLGWIAEELQDWRAALSAYRRASDLFTRHLGKEHPRTQICQSNLDRCLSAQSGRRS